MISTFVFVAVAMAVLCMLAIALPLVVRERRIDGEPTTAAPLAAVVSAAAVAVGAAGLYVAWSNWTGAERVAGGAAGHGTPGSVEDMVGQLARKLEREPDDLQGWLMLGRSYVVQGQYPLAARAYQRADRLAGGKDVEALTGWAEALILENEQEIEGRAGRLFEMALAIDPDSPKALFFGAVGAQRRGEIPQARQRFARLLELGAPEDIRPAIEQQIAALDAQIGGQPAPAGAAAPRQAAAPATRAAASPATGSSAAAAPAAVPAIRLRVVVTDGMRGAAAGTAALFVSARKPGQPGPPLAVKRLAPTVPQDVELLPSDSMVPGLAFAAGDTVEVTARLSRSGTANAASGDPIGRLRYDVGKDGVRELSIDSLTP
jgi:cytochrome c-type biogenesis protein CcmH